MIKQYAWSSLVRAGLMAWLLATVPAMPAFAAP